MPECAIASGQIVGSKKLFYPNMRKERFVSSQFLVKVAQKLGAALLAVLTILSAANAQVRVPSYIGPYLYTSGDGKWYPTDQASMDAAVASSAANNPTTCNHRAGVSADWQVTTYDPPRIEGVEVGASREFWIYYDIPCPVNANNTLKSSGQLTLRRRVVCSSWDRYLDGKCVGGGDYIPPGSHPGNLGPTCGTGHSCGQPINSGTGNMWHSEPDYTATRPGDPLSISRMYNSVPYGSGLVTGQAFGARWTHAYDARLHPAASSTKFYVAAPCWKRADTGAVLCPPPLAPPPLAIPDAMAISRGDGKQYLFNRADNFYAGDSNNNSRLIPTFNSDNTAVVAWAYISDRNDSTERFDANGLLLSITARNGTVQYLTYGDGSTNDTSVARYPFDAPVCPQVQTGPAVRTGLPLCVTDNWGRQLQFKYDTAGRIVEALDPAGQSYFYEYDGVTGGCLPSNPASLACSANNLTKVTFPDGRSRTYLYNELDRINGGVACAAYKAVDVGLGPWLNAMTGLIDEKGVRYISWTYDCEGKARSSELAGGVEKVSLSYQVWSDQSVTTPVTHYLGNPASPTTTVRDFRAYPIRNIVMNGSIAGPCVECGSIYWRGLDGNGNAGESTDFNGLRTVYTYDATRNLETSRTEDATTYPSFTRKISTNWHPTFRLPVAIAETKRITTFTYDTSGNLLTRSVQGTSDTNGFATFNATPVGSPQVWTYTYNSAGQVLTIDGPRTDIADITTFSYDAAGNLSTVTNALGHVTAYSDYDGAGRVRRITAPGGKVTTLQYTPRGLLSSTVSIADGISQATAYDYDPAGNLVKVTLPDASSLSYSYDDAHRLTGVVDNLGNRASYTLDLTGNRTAETVTDPGGTLTRKIARVFDALNRVQEVTGSVQ